VAVDALKSQREMQAGSMQNLLDPRKEDAAKRSAQTLLRRVIDRVSDEDVFLRNMAGLDGSKTVGTAGSIFGANVLHLYSGMLTDPDASGSDKFAGAVFGSVTSQKSFQEARGPFAPERRASNVFKKMLTQKGNLTNTLLGQPNESEVKGNKDITS